MSLSSKITSARDPGSIPGGRDHLFFLSHFSLLHRCHQSRTLRYGYLRKTLHKAWGLKGGVLFLPFWVSNIFILTCHPHAYRICKVGLYVSLLTSFIREFWKKRPKASVKTKCVRLNVNAHNTQKHSMSGTGGSHNWTNGASPVLKGQWLLIGWIMDCVVIFLFLMRYDISIPFLLAILDTLSFNQEKLVFLRPHT